MPLDNVFISLRCKVFLSILHMNGPASTGSLRVTRRKRDIKAEVVRGISLSLVLLYSHGLAQIAYPEAPEKWSKPVKLRELSMDSDAYTRSPSVTADGKTMYYLHNGISKSVWQDSMWSSPVPLNSNVNRDLAEGPSISPDGKRLCFRMYGRADGYGGWDLYYSDWDSVTRDWGPAKNLGPNINRADIDEWSCMTPDNRHLYWTRYPSSPRISTWNDNTENWGTSQWVDLYRFLEALGRASATLDGRKIYYDPFVETSNPSDIYVNYYDTLSKEWSHPMVLNINKMMDTVVSSAFYGYRRIQQDPWISADGKTLYFASTDDSTWAIWMSKLLIDENGNPVGVRDEGQALPDGFRLYQNYPNPFNPTTHIDFTLSSTSFTSLKVYDVLGREIATLVDEVKHPGRYSATFDSSHFSSGAYFYRLTTSGFVLTRKMLLIR